MILIEQHIDLNIYHGNHLKRYEVIQTWQDDFEITFKVLKDGLYVFTLSVQNDGPGFELSKLDRDLDIEIDWKLYSKIEAALYSVFLRDLPS
jgi:hypothetical protein